eukprot:1194258-Prorocentrum_minimum.AAC.9
MDPKGPKRAVAEGRSAAVRCGLYSESGDEPLRAADGRDRATDPKGPKRAVAEGLSAAVRCGLLNPPTDGRR